MAANTRESDRSILDDQLAELLGFSENVEDVVDYLLTIDAVDDLESYLEQLLGSSVTKQDNFRLLVSNLEKFKRGEAVVGTPKPAPVVTAAHLPTPTPAAKAPSEKTPNKSGKTKQQQRKAAAKAARKGNKNNSKGTKAASKHAVVEKAAKPSPPPPTTKTAQSQATNNAQQDEVSFRKLSSRPLPPQGEPRVLACGCFGTQHAVWVNCLYCGRIICEAEREAFCCFNCKYQLHTPNDIVRLACARPEAVDLKNKMLYRDKNGASQTKVYAENISHASTWNTGQEAAAVRASEQQRHAAVHQRQAMQMSISLY